MIAFGENADRIAAGGVIGARDGDGIEAARDQSGRGRGALDLSDDRTALCALQRCQEASPLAHPGRRASAQGVVRFAHLLEHKQRGLRVVDFLKHVEHRTVGSCGL